MHVLITGAASGIGRYFYNSEGYIPTQQQLQS